MKPTYTSKFNITIVPITIITLVLYSSCIDYFPLETPISDKILTVDGLISTGAGPHAIRLTYANKYTDLSEGNRITVKGALVKLVDQTGKETFLAEQVYDFNWYCEGGGGWRTRQSIGIFNTIITTGYYYTPDSFRIKIGDSYILEIKTRDGREFKSLPQTIKKVAKIDSVYFRSYSNPTQNEFIESKGIDIIIDFKDNESERNYYLWKSSKGYLELKTEPERGSSNPSVCCPICYIPDIPSAKFFGFSSDVLYNGLNANQPAFRIADDGVRFKSRYRIQIDQYSIDEDAHRFFKLIRQQLQIQGSVFDPLPANIRGNMYEVGNPEASVLGYFIASDVSSKMIYINKDDITKENRAAVDIIPYSCESYCGFLFEPPSLFPPDDWEYN